MNHFNGCFDLAQTKNEIEGYEKGTNRVFQFLEAPNHLTEDLNPDALLCVFHETETAFHKWPQITVMSTNGFPGEQHDAA